MQLKPTELDVADWVELG